jgi:hypothetical protein
MYIIASAFCLHRIPSFKQFGQFVEAGMVEMEYFVLGIRAGNDQLATGPFRVRVEHPHGTHFTYGKNVKF